jgi:hypothetical protein
MSDHSVKEVGSAILTRGGTYFDYLDPENSVITPEDIASGLSNTCRFSGHSVSYYSVAQHCVLASQIVEPRLAFQALMHDAAEAYLCDVPTPLKQFLPDYRAIEKRVERAIYDRFGLPWVLAPLVKFADRRMLRTEREDLMPPVEDIGPWLWLDAYPRACAERITPWSPAEAKAAWLERFAELSVQLLTGAWA